METQTEKKKLHITLWIAGIAVACFLLGFGAFGLIRHLYYGNRWYPGTTVNAIPVAGCTLEDSREKLTEYFRGYTLTVKGRDNVSLTIPGDQIGYQAKTDDRWSEAFDEQHSDGVGLFSQDEQLNVGLDVSYDAESLAEIIRGSAIVQGDEKHIIRKPVSAYAKYDKASGRYVCVPEQEGNTVQTAVLLSEVEKALRQGEKTLDLTDQEHHPDVYEAPAVTSGSQELQQEVNALDSTVNRQIRWKLDKDHIETVNPEQIARWISYKDGAVVFKKKKMGKWVHKFCSKYCTVGKTRKFKTHTGKKVSLGGGDYGWQISEEETLKQLKKSLKKETKETAGETGGPQVIDNKPAYLTVAHTLDFEGKIKDWDQKNYVEISLKDQMVYVFRKGKVAYSCRCVSGLPVKGRETRKGVYYIKEHRTNYTMVGEDYRTFTKYWIRVTWTGTGLHASTWQPWSRWTKTLYKTHGSHGCLNLSLQDAEKLYYMLKYREAVFIY